MWKNHLPLPGEKNTHFQFCSSSSMNGVFLRGVINLISPMDITHIFRRNSWNTLPEQEAKAILSFLAETRLPGFTIKSFEPFNKFNQHTFTAILDYNGHEFVFVPGDTVTLGLDHYDMTADARQNLAALTGLDITETDAYLRERLSPVRTVTIAPMVVERKVRETGYFSVAMDDQRLTGDDYFKKALDDLLSTPREKYTYTVNDSFRLKKNGTEISASLYAGATYDELVSEVSDSGFRLPTEDEWEYLCGGGSRRRRWL
jgi:formylglycine-generating enzyme required for sulfatase activity